MGEAGRDAFRSGTSIQHSTIALRRQSVYSRLAGYEDTNDAERLSVDPVMRHVVGGRTEDRNASAPPLPDELELYLLPRRRGRFMLYSRTLLLGQGDERAAVTDSPKVPEATLWTRAKTLYARLESKRPASEKVLTEVPEVTAVRIHYPASLSREQARTIYNELLETQIQKHKNWLIIDGALLPFSALLTLVPGPNLALEDVDHVAVLVDGAPEILPLTEPLPKKECPGGVGTPGAPSFAGS